MEGKDTASADQSDKSINQSAGRWGGLIRGIVPWLVSGGIIAYIVATEDMAAVVDAFGKARVTVFLGVFIPFLGILLLLETIYLYYGFRWFAGVGRFADLIRARAATYLLTVMHVFVGLGGLVVYGKKRYGVSYSRGTTIMLNELLHELATQCTLAMMVGLLLPAALVPDNAVDPVRGVMIVGMAGVGFYFLCILVSRLARFLPEKYRFESPLDPFVDISLWQYGVFYFIKLVQNIVYGLFLAGLLLSFNVIPPLVASVGFMQIIHLSRAIPISAFGIGVDQLVVGVLFQPWEPAGAPGVLLAGSIVFTFAMVAGRALLGVPFLRGVIDDLVERPGDEKETAASFQE